MAPPVLTIGAAGLLVDVDGTLVDSTASVEAHWRTFALRFGLDPDRVLAGVHGYRAADVIAGYADRLAIPAEQAVADHERSEVDDCDGVVALPGASELLGAVPRGRLALVTSGTRPVAVARLQAVGLPVDGHLVCAGDVVRGKPAPDPYVEGARRLGLSPGDCVAIEDAPPGIRSALDAGCTVIAVLTSHTWAQLADAPVRVRSLRDIEVATVADGLQLRVRTATAPSGRRGS